MSDVPPPTPEPVALPTDRAAAREMGARLIRQFEGCVLHPYQDQAGVWTIGIGSIRLADGSPVCADTPPISEDEAVALCEAEMDRIDDQVDASLRVYAPVCWHAALYSFAYNEGPGAERSSSTLRLLNAGQPQQAADALLLWDKVRDPATGALVTDRGLLNRRRIERAVALGLVTP